MPTHYDDDFMLWNKEFNCYKEQCLELAMCASFFGVKRMKSKTKYTYVKTQLAMLDQIHFLVCMYITMWAANKEENTWMIEANLIH